MVNLKELQKDVYKNKIDKGFNVTDINKEFCLTYGHSCLGKSGNNDNVASRCTVA